MALAAIPMCFYATLFILIGNSWSALATLSVSSHLHPRRVPPSRTDNVYFREKSSPVVQDIGAPTPAPTGDPSSSTTVYINDNGHFALLLPRNSGELISDAEADAVSFCYGTNNCVKAMPDGLITAAHVSNDTSEDMRWIQVTGCMDPSKSELIKDDAGGQFDVRFPQGAQCSFGGYGASFIELVEPAKSRFCLKCCAGANDQTNCNSHNDRDGCTVAVPGVYSFENGVSCED